MLDLSKPFLPDGDVLGSVAQFPFLCNMGTCHTFFLNSINIFAQVLAYGVSNSISDAHNPRNPRALFFDT